MNSRESATARPGHEHWRGRVARPGTGAAVQELSAEEVGHVELVAATINTMLTGASPTDDGRVPKASLAPTSGAAMRFGPGVI